MKKITITIFLLGTFVISCQDRLEELNQPTKDPTEVPAETLFASGVREMFDMMVNSDVNENVFRLYAQYWAQTTYPDESQYNMVGRRIPDNFWLNGYRDVLMDLEQARLVLNDTWEQRAIPEAEYMNMVAIINANKAYVFTVLVDAFGAVPFEEALDTEDLLPAYQGGSEVYDGVIAMLNEAINAMDITAGSFPANQDPVYGGDVEGWKAFANSLKLRIGVTLADVDQATASTLVQEALSGGVIMSQEMNASITYYGSAPNTNPVYEDLVLSGRSDYVVANTIVDKLKELDDPRLMVYAEPTEDGEYIGGEYGTANTYSARSHIGDIFHEPDIEGVILSYSEVNFLLAEAAEQGIAVPMSAAEYYEEGIRASMEYWGIEDAEIDAYLANPDVAYATAEGDWRQKIGIQEWISLFNRGYEGWTAWRRLDFEGFNVPVGLVQEDIPDRLIFPIEEATLNPSNLQEAIQMIGGEDNVQTHVFWDMN